MSQPKPSSKERVRAYRERMRAKGLRPVTLWVLDTRKPEVRAELKRQCEAIARAERTDPQAREDAAFAYSLSDDMLRRLDETEPYDWGPKGPPV
jgi:hypothetical protein